MGSIRSRYSLEYELHRWSLLGLLRQTFEAQLQEELIAVLLEEGRDLGLDSWQNVVALRVGADQLCTVGLDVFLQAQELIQNQAHRVRCNQAIRVSERVREGNKRAAFDLRSVQSTRGVLLRVRRVSSPLSSGAKAC